MQCKYQFEKIPDMDFMQETVWSGFCIATVKHPKSGSFIMETWKNIKGYEGLYLVSNLGRIKSLKRQRIRKIATTRIGYCVVNLSKDGIKKLKTVHRLVALAFVPNPDNKQCINHKDGNKLNNKIENLEWCTHSENSKHMVEVLGIKPHLGKKHPEETKRKIGFKNSKLTLNDILTIKKRYESGATQVALAKEYDVHYVTINNVINGRQLARFN